VSVLDYARYAELFGFHGFRGNYPSYIVPASKSVLLGLPDSKAEVALQGPIFQCADFLRRVTLIENPTGAGLSTINHRRSVPGENR
jgi:hypothetical protein